MKQLRMLGALAFGLYLTGCAGNGTAVTGGATDPIVGTPHIEMIYSDGYFPNLGLPIYGDPMNIRTGEQVQFELVGITASGARKVITPDFWRSTDTTKTFGTVSQNTGVFVASSRQTDTSQVITARYNGTDISTSYAVRPRQIRIIGSLLDRVTHLPIQGVTLYFYDVNGNYLGPATTSYDGSFRAAMPNTVARFQIVNDTLPDGYYRIFRFDSTLPIQTTIPNYLSNRNSNDIPIAVAFDQTGMQWRESGINRPCLPLLSSSSYANTDYYLQKPVIVAPLGDVDDFNNPIDVNTLPEGCSVP